MIDHDLIEIDPDSAIAHDIEGKPFVTGGADAGEATDSAEILEELHTGMAWLPYDNATVSWATFRGNRKL